MIGIYKITSPSGKVYIGQSRNIQKRWSNYKDKSNKKHPRLQNSFRKYGLKNHKFEIIEECEFEQLNIRERYWQDYYDVTGSQGLNCILVETSTLPRIISEETIQKTRESKLGEKNPMYGKKGELHHSFGTKRTPEQIEKWRNSIAQNGGMRSNRKKGIFVGENNPFYGKKHTRETIEAISKKVIDTATGIIYISAREAARAFNIEFATLNTYLLGKRNNKTTLLYLHEVEKLNEI